MKNAVKLVEALRYKLRMCGMPIEEATNVFYDHDKAVYKNTSLSESTLKKSIIPLHTIDVARPLQQAQCVSQKK